MIISQTPLRISLFGGGTDFPDFYANGQGRVLTTAIDKYVFVIVKERFDDEIYINYSRKEIVSSVDDVKHDLVREAMRHSGVASGVEITTLADIPSEGTGLGSSSAILVCLLQALCAHAGEIRTSEQLARDACEIEINRLGRPVGKQDQYIAAYGGLRRFSFLPDESVITEMVDIDRSFKQELDEHLMLIYTNRTRNSSAILKEQQSNTTRNMKRLTQLGEMVDESRRCFLVGDLARIGELLHESWLIKRQLSSGITDTEIDDIYRAARDAGATGGKLAGAGGGGFLLLFCPPSHRSPVRRALKGLREMPFRLERDGSKVVFNVRR